MFVESHPALISKEIETRTTILLAMTHLQLVFHCDYTMFSDLFMTVTYTLFFFHGGQRNKSKTSEVHHYFFFPDTK